MTDEEHPIGTGDRVIIKGTGPWGGYTGEIVEPFGKAGLDWVVELEDMSGHRTAQAADDLRRLDGDG